jgi:hypothetical protein
MVLRRSRRVNRLASLLWDSNDDVIEIQELQTQAAPDGLGLQELQVEQAPADQSPSVKHRQPQHRHTLRKRKRRFRLSKKAGTHAIADTHQPVEIDVGKMEAAGIKMKARVKMRNAGKLLEWCVGQVAVFRNSLGGESMAVFKIGIAAYVNIVRRFESYQEDGCTAMNLIHVSHCLARVEDFEAFLIHLFRGQTGCRNVRPGGESMRTKGGSARFEGPYVLYLAGARADQSRAIFC